MLTKLPYIYRQSLLYGVVLAGLLLIMKWLEASYLVMDDDYDLYSGLMAILFTGLGMWLTRNLMKPKIEPMIVEREVIVYVAEQNTSVAPFAINKHALEKTELSAREYEVLEWMAKGKSNKEIGEAMYLSEHTIKTHCSNIFMKMDVRRRTQAIEKGRQIGILP